MKVVQIIKKIFTTILGTAFYALAITLTLLLLNYNQYGVTQVDNLSLIKINGDISSENYKNGDLVIVESRKIRKINIGDELFTYRLDNSRVVSIDYGIVGSVYPEDNRVTFENGANYDTDHIAGVPIKVYPKIGKILAIAESKWGFLFIVLVPSFLIFIYSIYTLIVEIRYGKEQMYNY